MPVPQGTIVICEDNDLVRQLLVSWLGSQGYQVAATASGREAVELMSRLREEVRLLITDLHLPDQDVPAMVDRLLEADPRVQVILMSGYADEAAAEAACRARCRHLPKPFRIKELLEMVRDSFPDQ